MAHRLLLLATACCLLAGPFLYAQDGDLEAQVEAKLAEKVQEELQPLVERICEQLRVEYPPKPPAKSLGDVQREIDRVVTAAIREEVPANGEEHYAVEAARIFAPFVEGEEVTVTLNSGQEVSGRVYQKNQYFVQVSNNRISKQDLAPESRARFDKASSERAQAAYVKRQLARDEALEQRLRREKGEELAPPIYGKHGYRKYRGQWMAIVDLIDTALEKPRRQLEVKHRDWAENQVYIPRGYMKVAGEWRHLDDIEAERDQQAHQARERQKELAEEARKAREAREAARQAAAAAVPEEAPAFPDEPGDTPVFPDAPDDLAVAPPDDAIAMADPTTTTTTTAPEGTLDPQPFTPVQPVPEGDLENPFLNAPAEAPPIPEEKVRRVGDGFDAGDGEFDLDELEMADDEWDGGGGFGGFNIVVFLTFWGFGTFVGTLALWFGGKICDTETGIISCLLAAVISQGFSAFFMGSWTAAIGASVINYGVLWYSNRSAGAGSLIAQVLMANLIIKLLGWAAIILVGMFLAGALMGMG